MKREEKSRFLASPNRLKSEENSRREIADLEDKEPRRERRAVLQNREPIERDNASGIMAVAERKGESRPPDVIVEKRGIALCN